MGTARRFLVVRDDRMGDVMLATPVFQALKMTFSDCWVAVLVRSQTRTLLEPHPLVDEVIVDDREGHHAGWKGFWRLVHEVRRGRYDDGLVLWPTRRNMKALYWGGVGNIVSFGRRPFQYLWGDGVHRRRPGHLQRHEVENNLEVASLVGASWDHPRMRMELTAQDQSLAQEVYRQWRIQPSQTVAGLYPGHGGSEKTTTPLDLYVNLARRLMKARQKIVIGIGPAEIPHLESWKNAFKNIAVKWADPGWSPRQLAAVIARWQVFVGMSTGPMHVAAALGVPVVLLSSPIEGNSSRRWGPWGVPSRIISPEIPMVCPDCFGTRCPLYNCMGRISAEKVFQAIQELIHPLSPGDPAITSGPRYAGPWGLRPGGKGSERDVVEVRGRFD